MKILFFFIITSITFSTIGKTQGEMLPAPEANFFAVIVQDMDNSIEWYTSILGLKVINRSSIEERGFDQANLSRGSLKIELIQLISAISSETLLSDHPAYNQLQGLFKVGLTIANFDGWIDLFHQSEVHIHGKVVKDEESGKRMIIIKDPDGNRIQFFEK